MTNIFFVLLLITLLAVVGVMVLGVSGMAKGGDFNKKYGNRLMQARIALQALALFLFILAVMSGKS